MNKLQRRTKKMAEKMIGKWVLSYSGWHDPIFFVTSYDRHGMRLHAKEFGKEGSVTLKTRKFRLATEAEVAAVTTRAINNDPDVYTYKVTGVVEPISVSGVWGQP